MAFRIAPGRQPYTCYKPKANKDAILRWLAAHGPQEWHVAADIWNWDGGHDVLALIMEQPECDRATCQMIFGRSEAHDDLTDPADATTNDRVGVGAIVTPVAKIQLATLQT
jgi:hypothetical protein